MSSFDFGLIWDSLPLLIAGAGVTIEITAISVGLGFILGLVVSVCRLSGWKILKAVAVCYVNILRGTPLLVKIFVFYFALPML
ncbi:MAG: ABC transporter permease subunit, partial [Megasphaera lornae]